MAKFQFRDYSLKLEFPNCEFCIQCNSDVGDKAKEMGKQFDMLRAEYLEGKKTKQETVDFTIKSIDSILGDGASEKIFEGRDVTLSDAADVLIFIVTEANNFMRQKTAEAKRGNNKGGKRK